MNKTNFSHITLFTTALCNLNCSYCYICKDNFSCLKDIDDEIERDFKNNTYIKQVLDLDENLKDQIVGLTLWGGEPFLKIDRFLDKVDDFFLAFPKISAIDWSTNLTLPNQAQKIQELVSKVERHHIPGTAPITIHCQISIDGYPEMNDFGRGNGVTDKFLKNFYDLFELKFDQDKISFEVFTKPTLSKQTFHFLDTEEKCFKWFKFFNDKMYLPWKESKASWIYGSALFNLAQPTEWTPDDGYAYAKISNNLKNIREKVQKECEEFLVYKSLVPEANLAIDYILERSNNSVFLNLNTVKSICQSKNCGGGCGSFSHNLVLIPKGKFTMCHRGIFDGYVDYVNTLTSLDNMNNLATEYFKNTNVKDWIFTAEEFKQMSEMMLQLYEYPSCIWYTDIYKMIKEYAVAGVIDKKYLKDENIYPTLGYFLKLSSCIQDNYIFNGSWVTHSFLELPVLYNGTMDVVLEEYERVKGEKQHYDI